MEQKELREQENRCIQEHAPACMAACPVHVDVRGILAEDHPRGFHRRLKLYRKSVPFPGIISHICDQPCQPVCKRSETGWPNSNCRTWKRLCEYGAGPRGALAALATQTKTVAVIGAGLSGLTVAHDLARKG